MTIRCLQLLCILCCFVGLAASTEVPPRLSWRGPLQLIKYFFKPNALLQPATDISPSSVNGDDPLNVSILRDDKDNNEESILFDNVAQHDVDSQDSEISRAADSMPTTTSNRENVLNDRSIVFDSAVKSTVASKKRRSRTYPSTDDKFCTQDCSSRSYLPSNPEGHSFESVGRW